MSELHAAILAKIDEDERSLNEQATMAPFVVDVGHCTCYGGMAPYGHEPGCGSEPGEQWWVIEYLRRGLAEDRDILARHVAAQSRRGRPPVCTEDMHDLPCPDVLSVARRHGVSPQGQEETR